MRKHISYVYAACFISGLQAQEQLNCAAEQRRPSTFAGIAESPLQISESEINRRQSTTLDSFLSKQSSVRRAATISVAPSEDEIYHAQQLSSIENVEKVHS